MAVMEKLTDNLNALFEGRTTTIARDLKLNLTRSLTEGALSEQEAAPALLGVAVSANHAALAALAEDWMRELGYEADVIQEAREGAALMNMLNTYYSFRQKLGDENYGPAGLRMTALARPVMGKVRFEMLAFAVSVLNGCQTCITSHEKVLREAGASTEKLHDLARMACVVKAVSAL